MDGKGNIAFAMNSSGMYRGWVTSAAPAATAIYSNEAGPVSGWGLAACSRVRTKGRPARSGFAGLSVMITSSGAFTK